MSAMYNKAIRMVHPDINPQLKDAHELSVLVNRYKNDDHKLELFVNSWQKHGFDANIQQFINVRVNPTARPQGLAVNIRDKVKIPTSRKRMPYLEGIIIKIGRVTRGKLRGYHKITVVDKDNRTWNYKCRTYDKITVMGQATRDEYMAAKYAKPNTEPPKRKNEPFKPKMNRWDFADVGLRRNFKYYEYPNIKQWVTYQGKEYLVYRTGYSKVLLTVPGKKSCISISPKEVTSSRREV